MATKAEPYRPGVDRTVPLCSRAYYESTVELTDISKHADHFAEGSPL
jgi:hypothetical protein